MPENDVNFTVGAEGDEGSFRATGDALERALLKALDGIGAKIAAEFMSEFKKGTSGSGAHMKDIKDNFKKVGDAAQTAGRESHTTFNRLEEDLEKLAAEARATQAAFLKMDFPPDLAQAVVVARDHIVRLLHDLQANQKDFLNDPGLGDYYREQGLEARTELRSATTALRRTQESLSKERVSINRKEVAQINADRSKLTAEMQQETTRIRAENKVRQAETRAHAERTNRIFKAAAKEFFIIQRAMGKTAALTARGIGTAFQGAARTVGASFSRLGGIFRRQNVEMTAGLDSALDRRETIMRSSFNTQESIVRNSVITQSRQIDRMERQLSKGVLGAATGRSALGGLLGGGLAIGGGFALAAGFRRAIDLGGDFVQGLRVLDAQLGLTDKQMESIRQTSLDLGNDITLPGVSALDAAQAIQLLTKQFGAMGDQAAPAAEAAAKGVLALSRATGSTAEDAARVVGSAINIFGIEAGKAVQVADQVTGALSRAAGVGFDDFSRAFQQSATVFAQFQVPAVGAEEALVDFNTAIAVLARGGLIGSDAGTSLKQFFLQANRGTVDSEKNLKALAERAGELGTVFFDQSGNARSLSDALAIMRKGLKGLTDEERTGVLQKIFGSDAIRAAEILTKTSEKTFDTIEKGVRRDGLAAEVAAAQNEGLRGALDALSSVIDTQLILAYESLQDVAGEVVLHFADFANKIFSADGAFAVFRTTIKGVAAGLGALLVVKTVAEGFGLLKVALRGLLTPFGVMLLLFAGAGAAIALLQKHSPKFREVMEDIKDTLGDLASGALKQVRRGIDNFADLLSRTVVPAVEDAAEWIGDHLGPAFEAIKGFITKSALPAIGDFIDKIKTGFIPAVQSAWEWLTEKLGPAFGAVAGFVTDMWNKIQPVLAPIGEAFANLGSAVVDFFKGDIGIGDVGGAFGGIGTAIGEVAVQIFDGIVNLATNAFNSIKEFVGNIDWAEVGFTILDAVEEIGFQIGNILTDPETLGRAVLGAAAIASALGAVALRLVQGLALAVKENIGEFGQILGPVFKDALGEALEFALENPVIIVAAIAGAIATAAVASSVVSAWQNFGKKGATQLAKGVNSEMPRALNRFGREGTFIQGLFGSPASINRDISRNMSSIRTQVEREIRTLSGTLQRAGRVGVGGSLANVAFGDLQATRDELQRRFNQLEKEVGPARAAGLKVGGAFAGGIAAFKGATGFKRFTSAIGTIGSGLSGTLKQAGVSMGNTLAVGIGSGVSGFFAGKTGDQTLGIGTILGATAAGAVAGPWTAAFAGATAAAGVFFGNLSAQHAKAKAEVQEYTDALLGASGVDFQNLALGNILAENLATEGVGVRQFFIDTQLSFEELARVISSEGTMEDKFLALAGQLDLTAEEFQKLVDIAAKPGGLTAEKWDEVAEVIDIAGVGALEFGDILGVIRDEGGEIGTAFAELELNRAFVDQAEEGKDKVQDLATASGDAATKLSDMFAARADAASGQLDALRTKADEAGAAADAAREELRQLISGVFDDTAQEQIDDVVQVVGNLREEGLGVGEFRAANVRDMVRSVIDPLRSAAETTISEGVEKGLSRKEITGNLDELLFTTIAGINANKALGEPMKQSLREQVGGFFTELEGKPLRKAMQLIGLDEAAAAAQAKFERREVTLQAKIEFSTNLAEFGAQIAQMDPGPAQDRLLAIFTGLSELTKRENPGGKIGEEISRGMGGADAHPAARRTAEQVRNGLKSVPMQPIGEGLATSFAQGLRRVDPRPAGIRIAEQFGKGAKAVRVQPIGEGLATSFAQGLEKGADAHPTGHRVANRFRQGAETVAMRPVGEGIAAQFSQGLTAGADAHPTGQRVANRFKAGAESVAMRPVGEGVASQFQQGLESGADAHPTGHRVAERFAAGAESVSMRPVGEGLATSFAQALTTAETTAQESGASTGGAFGVGITGTTEAVSGAALAVSETASASLVVAAIQAAFNGAIVGESFATGVSSAEGSASSAGASLASAAASGASGVSLYSVGSAMASGIAQGLRDGAQFIYDLARSIASEAVRQARAAVGASSPAKATIELGRDMATGMALGLAQGTAGAVEAARAMVNDTFGAMEEIISSRSEIFEQIFGGGRAGRMELKIGFEAGLDDLVKGIADLKEELRKTNEERAKNDLPPIERDITSIDPGTEAGRTAREMFNNAADAAKDILAGMIESGKTTKQIQKRFTQLRDRLIESAEAAGFSAEEIRTLLKDAGLSAENIAKFMERADKATRRDLFEGFIGRFQGLIEGVVTGVGKGKSIEEQFKLVRQGLLAAGADPKMIARFSEDIRKMIQQQRRDPSARIERYLARIAKAQEEAAELARAKEKGGVLLPGLGRFQGEIESFIESMRGQPMDKVLNDLVAMMRSVGIEVGPKEKQDLRDFIKHMNSDKVLRFQRAIERAAKAAEEAAAERRGRERGGVLIPGLGRFQSEIESFVENMEGVPFPQVRKQLVGMLRSIGVEVGPKQIKDLGEFIKHLRGDKVKRFADAIDEAAERLETPEGFIDSFQSQFDRIIEEFSGNPAKIREEINKALRHAGLGRQAGKYAREINQYIRGVLEDPGRKLDQYLDKLLETQEEEQQGEFFAPVMHIYPPSGDPHAQALVLLNRLAAERPRGY